MISLQSVSKLYNEGRPNEMRALSDVTLEIPASGTTVIKGPSGSGKTTLLSIIGCMARPTTGRVLVRGKMVSGLPEAFLAAERRLSFGFVFQRFNLIRGLSALDNVMLPAAPLGPDFRALKARALDRLDQLGLAAKADTAVEYLSGGETQRVAIARALINDAKILIADEPTASLDTELTARFLQITRDLTAEGRAIIMTSHDPRIWEAPGVSRVIEMRDGRVIEGAV